MTEKNLNDIQNLADPRNLDINKVGINSLRMPISVVGKDNVQHTVADISMSVSLSGNYKGTHMSRFTEIFNSHRDNISLESLPRILDSLRHKLGAQKSYLTIEFPYFINKQAPVSKMEALMDYDCCFIGESDSKNYDVIIEVKIPVTSVCPCSKAISDYGAHNQRGIVSLKIRTSKNNDGSFRNITIEELVEVVEKSASAPVYSLLKRPDERYVTMQAYDNPVFVEDIVRNIAVELKKDLRIEWFSVNAENQESIHNHNAFACIEWTRNN